MPVVARSVSVEQTVPISAIQEALAGDPVDVLIGDYLAEITMAVLAGQTRANPGVGFA